MEILKTITLGDENQPHISLCPGHVDADAFNRAHIAEGWSGDPVASDQLRHELWKRVRGGWRKCTKECRGARPVTVMDW